ncbi:MAG: thioredoxin domain-containing protein [Ktedonobacterales bacterium]
MNDQPKQAGTPRHTNRLIRESSPYLLKHAHNPVDWYTWDEEALAKAKAEDKPILLSVGYAACHWCSVMERESFENEDTARLMNEYFVSIKVDREERPDIDGLYMDAVQALTGSGGWPMTVFLTPDGAPFFGGTYFPPRDRYGMPGFPKLLRSIAEYYRTRRDEVEQQAEEFRQFYRRQSETEVPLPRGFAVEEIPSLALDPDMLRQAADRLLASMDAVEG